MNTLKNVLLLIVVVLFFVWLYGRGSDNPTWQEISQKIEDLFNALLPLLKQIFETVLSGSGEILKAAGEAVGGGESQ